MEDPGEAYQRVAYELLGAGYCGYRLLGAQIRMPGGYRGPLKAYRRLTMYRAATLLVGRDVAVAEGDLAEVTVETARAAAIEDARAVMRLIDRACDAAVPPNR